MTVSAGAPARCSVDGPLAGVPAITFDGPRLPVGRAAAAVGRSVVTTAGLVARRTVRQPSARTGMRLRFGDGTEGRVYRETVIDDAPRDAPVVLVVCFRLRWVRRPWAHAVFRAESLLNTPLFAGFPGFVSKLWVAHDEHGRYRGVYQWNHAHLAEAYVGALRWVLAAVCQPGSVHHAVVDGLARDELLARPALLERAGTDERFTWWRVVATAPLSA